MRSGSSDWLEAYNNYSRWGLTDPHAPVQAGGEIWIHAHHGRVWNILTDVAAWPRLRPDIECALADGTIQLGATCTLETAGVSLLITFGFVDAPREINWTTSTPGLVMTNRYVLVPMDGSTRVVSRETIMAPSFPQFDQAAMTDRIGVWLSALKVAAESA